MPRLIEITWYLLFKNIANNLIILDTSFVMIFKDIVYLMFKFFFPNLISIKYGARLSRNNLWYWLSPEK